MFVSFLLPFLQCRSPTSDAFSIQSVSVCACAWHATESSYILAFFIESRKGPREKYEMEIIRCQFVLDVEPLKYIVNSISISRMRPNCNALSSKNSRLCDSLCIECAMWLCNRRQPEHSAHTHTPHGNTTNKYHFIAHREIFLEIGDCSKLINENVAPTMHFGQ